MPLNPNGKIDKPNLPFPDTAQAASVEPKTHPSTTQATPTEQTLQSIWSKILPNAPSPVPLDESFFDLGGHSILATRLIFEIRKTFVINAPLGLIFDQPTISGLASEVDDLRNADLGLTTASNSAAEVRAKEAKKANVVPVVEYGKDYETLVGRLRPSYPGLPDDFESKPVTVFLTGATGFLGAFVLRDLLGRVKRVKKVICLVRAANDEKAVERLREGASDRGVWDEEWVKAGRLEVVRGDLDQEKFGLDEKVWNRVADEADAVLHNGALVRLSLNPNRESKVDRVSRSIGSTHTSVFAPRTSSVP